MVISSVLCITWCVSSATLAVSAPLVAGEDSGLRRRVICRPLFLVLIPLVSKLCGSTLFSSDAVLNSQPPVMASLDKLMQLLRFLYGYIMSTVFVVAS